LTTIIDDQEGLQIVMINKFLLIKGLVWELNWHVEINESVLLG